jgi:hypothetical protein
LPRFVFDVLLGTGMIFFYGRGGASSHAAVTLVVVAVIVPLRQTSLHFGSGRGRMEEDRVAVAAIREGDQTARHSGFANSNHWLSFIKTLLDRSCEAGNLPIAKGRLHWQNKRPAKCTHLRGCPNAERFRPASANWSHELRKIRWEPSD